MCGWESKAFMAQKESGHRKWNLHGNHGGLEQSIRTMPSTQTGLNLENDRSYFVVFEDGTVMCNPVGTNLTKDKFRACDRRA